MRQEQVKLTKYRLQLRFPWIAGPLAAVPVYVIPHSEMSKIVGAERTQVLVALDGINLYVSDQLQDNEKLYQNFGLLGYLILKEGLALTAGYPLRGIKKDKLLWLLATEIKMVQIMEELEWKTPEVYTQFRIKAFDEWSAEQIYYYLLRNAEVRQAPSNSTANSFGSKSGKSSQKQQQKSSQTSKSSQSGSSPDSESDGSNDTGIGDDSFGDEENNIFNMEAKFTDPKGGKHNLKLSVTFRKSYERNDQVPEDLKQFTEISRNIETSMRLQGTIPAGLLREIRVALGKGRINWVDTVFHYIMSKFVNVKLNWVPPSKRLMLFGMYMPAILHERNKYKVWVMLDTSGSISDDELKNMALEIINLFRAVDVFELRVTYVDADVQGEITVENAEEFIKNYRPKGGGGTDFRPFFKHVEKHLKDGEEYDVYLVFTDGYATYPKDFEEKDKVYWFLIDKGGTKPPFGNIFYLNA